MAILVAGLASCMASTQLMADSEGLEEIVVTAQKRTQDVNTVPLTIATVSGEDLFKEGITTPNDLTRIVPGFNAVTSQGGAPVYYLRGVGFYDVSLSAKPTVATYLDEAVLPYSGMSYGTTFDLERVEVLKGPQGTLFGSNSTGGALNFITAKPTREFQGGVGLSYGRYNDAIVDAFVSGPLSETVSARLAVNYQNADGWQQSYTRDDTNGSKDILNARGIVRFEPTEDLSVQLTVQGTSDKSESNALQLVGKDLTRRPLQPQFIAFPLAPEDESSKADWSPEQPLGHSMSKDNDQVLGILRVDYSINSGITLTSLTNAVRTELGYGLDADGTDLAITNFYVEGELKTFAQELRASGTLPRNGQWIVGANGEWDRTEETQHDDLHDASAGNVFAGTFGLPGINHVPIYAKTKSKSYAAFANAEFDVVEKVKAHLGVRYTHTSTDFWGCTIAADTSYTIPISIIFGFPSTIPNGECTTFTQQPDGTFDNPIVTDTLTENNVSWRTGLDWTPIDSTMLYVTVAKGFKAGQYSDVAGVLPVQYEPVPQEKLTDYEIGVKSEVVPSTLQINAAAFYYDYRDKQLQGYVIVPIFNALQTLISIPKSSVKGAELEANWYPMQGLSINLAGTYVKSEVKSSYDGRDAFGVPTNFKGSAFPNSPKWQGNAGAEYKWPVSSGLEAFVAGNLTYRSSTNGDFNDNSQLRIDSYSLLDARAGVESGDGKWSVQLWGRNLTDKYYWTSQTARLESIVRNVGMPRTYGISGTYRY